MGRVKQIVSLVLGSWNYDDVTVTKEVRGRLPRLSMFLQMAPKLVKSERHIWQLISSLLSSIFLYSFFCFFFTHIFLKRIWQKLRNQWSRSLFPGRVLGTGQSNFKVQMNLHWWIQLLTLWNQFSLFCNGELSKHGLFWI